MALDYSARRQVSRNRPKRRPIKLFVVLILGGAAIVFGLGVITGWLFFSYRSGSDRHAATSAAVPAAARKDPGQASTNQPPPPPETTDPRGEVPMTFFKTLPSGEKGIIGSGINLRQDSKLQPAGSETSPSSNVSRAGQKANTEEKPVSADSTKTKSAPETKPTTVSEKTPEHGAAASAEQPAQQKKKESWSVQVASYQNRSEAEELTARLKKKGLSPRIVESRIPGKGVWYRVRVGTGMERDSAGRLATDLGKNAIAIPE